VDSFTLNKIEFDSVRGILAEFCSCSLGKSLAKRISPSRNPRIINTWLEQTTQMVRAIRDVGLPPFGGVSDISDAMGRAIPGGGSSGEDYARIAEVLEGAANVKSYLNALPEELERLHGFAGRIDDFSGEIKAIRSIVASDGSILDEASEKLTKIRREIASVTQHIHDVIYGYLREPEVARLLQNVTVTLHGDRYVLPVKAENRGRLPGVVHRESNTGATVFVEPNASVELNNRLADLYVDEREEIGRLLHQLAVRVHARSEQIVATLRILGQVDLLSAKAQYAYQFDMACPAVTERGALQFNEARHPLLIDQEWRARRAVSEHPEAHVEIHPVVPIDVRLGIDFDILVVTGSNTGGKTVALKTVALLAVMAQSGMHIPAQRGATMPVFRDVFIDIGDEQSLEQSLSTFGGHIKRIRYTLRRADKTSLVLLDELGAGTDPDEGGAIGQAVLDELLRIGCLGMMTTHLSILKAYAFSHERVDNASVEFDTATLSPTYHLKIGTPGESHAITVAKKLGMPKRVTAAARAHLTGAGKQFRKAIRATGQVRQVAEKARQEAQTAQLAARSQQEVYEAKLADLHALQREFETWLASLEALNPGDEIFVPSLKKTGRLVRLELHQQKAVVDTGNLEVEVPLRELMPDLGQSAVREDIASLRQQILEQAAASEKERDETARVRTEYHQSLGLQKQRARQFDQWLGAIARLKVGDVVPIARRPGRAKVVKVDLPALRVTVEANRESRRARSEGKARQDAGSSESGPERATHMVLPLQDLFPQTGPFARQPKPPRKGRPASKGHPSGKGPAGKRDKTDRPMRRVSEDSKTARKNRDALLAIEPGKQVFVVPFNKRATLIRMNPDKDLAVVQSGIFEMELPLADLEPV
jgi:DNA mismatch repair protein MutS2